MQMHHREKTVMDCNGCKAYIECADDEGERA
jgi:hypothetical protein